MRWIACAVLLLQMWTTAGYAQDTLAPPARTAYAAMVERLVVDDRGQATALTLHWNRWNPGHAAFEGSVGLLAGGSPGGFIGDAGGAYMIGGKEVTLLLRGGVSVVAVPAFDAIVGAYGGVALLIGPGSTALRLEIARHEYSRREDNLGFWMIGLGLAFIPRSAPTGRCR